MTDEQFAGLNKSPDQLLNQPQQVIDREEPQKESSSENLSLSGSSNSLADIAAAQAKKTALPPRIAPFAANKYDGLFALLALALGYLFSRWVFFYWQGWGVTAFTFLYCGLVTGYLIKKEVSFSRESWFWLIIVLITGASFSIWNDNSLGPFRSLLLFCGAVYWVVCAAGLPILGKTSNWLVLDGVNAFLLIPFSNFSAQYKSFAFLLRNKKAENRKFLSIMLGVLLALLVAAMVLPLLMEADNGGFAQLTKGIAEYFQWMQGRVLDNVFYCILAIPVSAYLFGLVSGCAHKRGCASFEKEIDSPAGASFRLLPTATVYTFLGLLSLLYLVYIASQVPYFFSAFLGLRPEGFEVYSEYARRGFFELCSIAAINLAVLTAVNLLCKKPRAESLVLKIFNILLSLITLFLIATAVSKMALYIGAYGLSVRRLLPCVFMIFLGFVCIAIMAMQKINFSILRFSAVLGAVMLCLLCLADPDGITARYNAGRYLSGTLSGFDTSILYNADTAGVSPALEVYEKTADPELKAGLSDYLVWQRQKIASRYATSRDNLQTIRARAKIEAFAAEHPFIPDTINRGLYLDIR